MADGSTAARPSLRDKVSEEEWKTRVELAALYRLVAHYGWDDMIYNHISGRIPGPEHQFLINPFGLLFSEITASSLIRIDLDGKVLQETSDFINPAGFVIHSAVHAAREDAQFVMHLHTNPGVAVSAQEEGLLPLTQTALIVRPHLAYHDYDEVSTQEVEVRGQIAADLGPEATLMVLRNHGTLGIGETAADCWVGMYYLERACAQQVMALAAGWDKVSSAPKGAQSLFIDRTRSPIGKVGGQIAWSAMLRLLDREHPGYAA